MKRKNATLNALFTSVIALLLCVSMLVGTTFAWFTDEVVTGMNTIAAGNLDVELLADGVKVESDTKLFNLVDAQGNDTWWEPGMVVYENLQVANVGTLALKYQMTLNFGNENNLNGRKLSEVLKVAVLDQTIDAGTMTRVQVLELAKDALAQKQSDGALVNLFLEGELEAKTDSPAFAVVIFWEPNDNNTDNLYNANNGKETSDKQPLRIEFGVKLEATQKMSEEDSFGPDYDEGADLPEFAPTVNPNFITDGFTAPDGTDLKQNITGIVFGTKAQYPEIVAANEPVDVENGVSIYQVKDEATTYQVRSTDKYTLYYLSESGSPIKLPADSTGLFRDMKGLTSFDGTNLDMSQVTSAKYLFRDSTNITEIKGAENWDMSNVTSTRGFLYNCSNLENLDVSKWDVSNVEDAGWMFYNCQAVAELDVSEWDTSSMNFTKSMFYNNTKLTELDVENWDMSDVTDTSYMFSYCTNLGNVDLSKWDVSNVQYFNNMFKHARAMDTLDLSTWDTSSAVDMNHMFANAYDLVNLDISGFDTSKVTTMAWMFYEVDAQTIYVGDKWSLESIKNLDEGVYSYKIANAKLVGGQGTTCRQIMDLDSKCVAENGARINATARYMIADGGEQNPGLLTYKAN